MAGKGVRSLHEAMRALSLSTTATTTVFRQTTACSTRIPAQKQTRSMASQAPLPNITRSADPATIAKLSSEGFSIAPTVPVTLHAFPSLEPVSLESWSSKHLNVPLRRDLLHLAVVYEGDATRQGTASSKTRFEIRGSNRKIRPQKGSGRARLGDKKSPMLRGGGKTFGPKPRDFSTRLNRKVYDRAWRTALSYRYRRGELTVAEDGLDLPLPEDFLALAAEGRLGRELEDGFVARYARETLAALGMGRAGGRTTFITAERRPNLFTSLEAVGTHGRALEIDDVDVKDLLETGRIVIERSALLGLVRRHQSDLVGRILINGQLPNEPPEPEILV